jgi:hypothetical protein
MKDITSHITETGDGYDQTKAGLIRKRADMLAEIEGLQALASARIADLHALETTLRIFDPDIAMDGLPARRLPPIYQAFRGEIARFVLDVLRGAPDGLTTREITVAMMKARQLNPADKAACKLIQKRAGHSLMKLRSKGALRSAKDDPSGMLRWWLA